MATSIWEVATEGTSAFDIVGGYMSDVELSYEDRAAIDVATESDTGFVDYINDCQMALMDNASKTFAQESVLALQVAKGMDMYTAMEGLKSTIRNAWEAIKEFLQKVWETIKEYVKKAKDWLARRASLGRAMLTKYSSVLRNKKVSNNLKFDWCEIDLKKFANKRSAWMDSVIKAYGSDNTTTISQLQQLLANINTARENLKKEEEKKKNNPSYNTKPAEDALNKALATWEQDGAGNNYFTTQGIAEEMRTTLYGNATGPVHNEKTWPEIKDPVMQWADMDPSRYLSEALGVFEKDSNAMMKIIKQQQKNYEEAIDDELKSGTLEKKAESMVRSKVRQIAAGGAKVHKMYITHLKEAISLMQTQAIAAARKAILDKGTTTNESYIFNGMDVIY